MILSLGYLLEKRMATLVFLLENSMDRGAWRATVQGVAESDLTEQISLHFSSLHKNGQTDKNISVKMSEIKNNNSCTA